MTAATGAATPAWTCGDCGVTVTWMPGSSGGGLPDNWVEAGDGHLCLQCRRARAQEAAVAALGGSAGREERAKRRRTALLEFELTRDPERPDSAIARACRSSVPAVGKARRSLAR